MKVGIITFHKVNNYGAVLQAFALQKTVQKLGCECEIIDYGRKNLRDVLLWQKNKIQSILRGKPDHQGYSNLEFLNMYLTTIFFNKKDVSEKFEAFRDRMPKSKFVNSDTVKELNKDYDLFISGSDQVWNCGRVILDKNYFLEFVSDDLKKGSYAASFGIKEIPDKYVKDYKNLLSKYKFLSVREQAGADIIKKLIQKEAKVVLDPTLLLHKDEWQALLPKGKKSNILHNPVIVVYMLEYSEKLLQFARKLKETTNGRMVLLNKPFRHKVREESRTDVGPVEWLQAINDADYVVTNSFHGVAFSINFNKVFFVEIAEERIRGAMSSRIEHILKTFHLENRFIRKQSVIEPDQLIIDYSSVNKKLEELRKDSVVYLENMIGNGNKC